MNTDEAHVYADQSGETTKKFPVMEIFGPTIQGEGAMCGKVSYFLRLGGCGYRCSWCDSMHAVDPKLVKANASWLHPNALVAAVQAFRNSVNPNNQLDSCWITISGGDPVMWDLYEVVSKLQALRYKIAVETQGEIWRPWLRLCSSVTISPKPPSSGMADRINYDILDQYVDGLNYIIPTYTGGNVLGPSFKVVVFNSVDFEWAKALHKRYLAVPFYMSVGTSQGLTGAGVGSGGPTDSDVESMSSFILADYRDLVSAVLSDPDLEDISVLPQVHCLIWGAKQGV